MKKLLQPDYSLPLTSPSSSLQRRLRLTWLRTLAFGGCIVLGTSLARADITSGLTAHFKFDETSGTTAADSSGKGNNASLINFPTDGTPYWIPGRIGGALEFCADGGDDDQVVTDNPIILDNQDTFTFAFWAKRKSDNNPFNPRLMGPVRDTDGQYWVLWAPGTGVGFYPPAKSPEPIRDVWQHFVVTYNRPIGKYVLYVDGVKKAEKTDAGYIKNEAGESQWVVGHKELLNDNRDPWRGYLDDVRMYNRILTDADIQELYAQAPPLPPAIVKQPRSGAYNVGENLQLSVVVDGTPPITYQWSKDGGALAGGTNDLLNLTNLQAAAAGVYTVVVGNVGGSNTSAAASITIQPVTSVTNRLAGYWKFDETTGINAADSSGLGNNGTVNNNNGDGGQWATGAVGGALTFRGPSLGDDYVVVPSFPRATNGTMTLSAWVWADALTDRGRVACGGSGLDGIGQFLLTQYTGGNDLGGYVGTSTGQPTAREGASTPFPTNSWQHVALVADGTTLRVYRNGAEVASTTYDGTLVLTTNALSIGARLTADDTAVESGLWQGKMDEMGYWLRGLTADEVAALFAAGHAGKSLTLADQYKSLPPIISQLSPGPVLVAGNSLSLRVWASGASPVSYQWKKDGQDILTATNASYRVDFVQVSDAGSYTVTVSNAAGSTTSQSAVVTVSDPPVDLTNALLLYLKFDETNGVAAKDSSGKANHASLLNFPTDKAVWQPGIIGGALLFNQADSGDDDAVVTDAAITVANPDQFSFAFWAKPLSPYGTIFNPRFISPLAVDHWILWKPGFGVGIWDQVPATVEPSGDTWHHFAVIFDRAASKYDVYVDGTRKAEGAPGTKAAPGDVQWIIGHSENIDNASADNFRGLLDDMRMYNRLITPKEVQALYQLGKATTPSLTISRSGGDVVITWPADAAGFALESSSTLSPASWTAVAGVSTNTATITPAAGPKFYRLRK